MNLQIWREIPVDILHLILQFDGRIKKRNGVYINQILVNDERYRLLQTIPKKVFFGTSLNEKRLWMVNNRFVRETFVYFRHKRDENNRYYTIYFEEQLDPPPFTTTHHFSKCFFVSHNSFILP